MVPILLSVTTRNGEGKAGLECLNIIENLGIASFVVIEYPKEDSTVTDQRERDEKYFRPYSIREKVSWLLESAQLLASISM